MARTGLGDLGLFMPPETAHRWPGAYENILRGEALKSAKYLSAMDQFYAGLEQAQEQFEATLEWQKEKWESSVELQKWLKWRDVNLGRRGIRAQSRSAEAALDWDKSKYAQETSKQREVFEFYKGLMEKKQDPSEDLFGRMPWGGQETPGGDSDFWGGEPDWRRDFILPTERRGTDRTSWEGWEHGEYGSGGSKSDWGDWY